MRWSGLVEFVLFLFSVAGVLALAFILSRMCGA